MEKKRSAIFDYKWVVIVSCFLMIMLSLGFASSTKSLFPDEIAKDLGTERSLVAIGESCRYIATAVVNIFFGALIARFGAKTLACAGTLALAAGTALYSVATTLPAIYLAGTLLGIGFSWTGTTMVGYVVGVWCAENKGTIMGAILASNGIGGAIAIQVVGRMIDPTVVGSYRDAYRLITLVLLSLFVFLLIFFRSKPKNAELPVHTAHKKKRGRDWVGITLHDALRKPYFWGALVCVFFSGFILQGSHGILAMHYKDVGIDYAAVTAVLSFSSLILALAKLFTGFLYDRKGLRLTASLCTAIAILTTLLLVFVKEGSTGFVLAVIYAALSPFAMPLETVLLPIYAADLFGQKEFAKFLGILVSANVAGYALGAPLFNLAYDLLGSYVPALIAVSVLMSAIFVLLQFVITCAHREQKKCEQAEKTEAPLQ